MKNYDKVSGFKFTKASTENPTPNTTTQGGN